MNKIEKKMKENATIAIQGKAIKILNSKDFDTPEMFSDYKTIVDGLQSYLYEQSRTGKAPKGKSMVSYAKAICKALSLSIDSTEKVVKKLTTTKTVVPGKNGRELTPESKAELRRFNDIIRRIESKEVTKTYSFAQKEKEITEKIKLRDDWRKEKATYTVPLFSQKKDSTFRRDLEACISYALIDQDDSATWISQKERIKVDEWNRWYIKAVKLNLDITTYRKNKDLDGLKKAVREEFERQEKTILDKALETNKE